MGEWDALIKSVFFIIINKKPKQVPNLPLLYFYKNRLCMVEDGKRIFPPICLSLSFFGSSLLFCWSGSPNVNECMSLVNQVIPH